MNSIAAKPAITLRDRLQRGHWISSPGFDIALLIFAPLVTLPIIVGVYFRIPFLAITCGIVLAFSHYLSTAAFFFWKENRDYHRSRWIAFYLGPFILMGVYVALLGFAIPFIIQVVLFAWNTWHVSRQNQGILSIYRQRAGVAEPLQRNAANHAIFAVSAFLALWNIETHREWIGMFGLEVSRGMRYVAGGIALFFLARLGMALLRRQAVLGVPEALFLAASLGFFWPYLFIKDSGIATFAMLLPHYVQYMALVWLLHRRKFGAAGEDGAGVPSPLRGISSKLWILLPVLAAVGYFFVWLRDFSIANGLEWHFESLYLLIALTHYYLDGLIWSFRQPHVRKSIGAFLFRREIGA